MRFQVHRRRQPPTVIIISLIDILIVLLIFLMVTTTFKRQPALKLTLPEAKEAQPGATEASLVVTVSPQEPHFYLGTRPLTAEQLQAELVAQAARNPALQLSIQADEAAAVKQFVQIIDIARAAHVPNVSIFARRPPTR